MVLPRCGPCSIPRLGGLGILAQGVVTARSAHKTTASQRQSRYPQTLTSLPAGGLLRLVEYAPTLRASDDFLLRSHFQDRLVGDFHVATGADFMLDGDKGQAVLAFEKTVVAVEEVLLDSLGESWTL